MGLFGNLFSGLFGSGPSIDRGYKNQVTGNLDRINALMGTLYGPNALLRYMDSATGGFDASRAGREGAGLSDLSGRYRARTEGTGGTLYGGTRDRFIGEMRANAPYQIQGQELAQRANLSQMYANLLPIFQKAGKPGLLPTIAQGIGLYQGMQGNQQQPAQQQQQQGPSPYGYGGGGGGGGGWAMGPLAGAPGTFLPFPLYPR